jgi:hypothetical protein
MSYAILRTKKITTTAQMTGMNNHNHRLNNVMNADKDLTHLNHNYSAFDPGVPGSTGDLKTDIYGHIDVEDIQTKKNSVLAIEHLMTFSPDFVNFTKVERQGKPTLKASNQDIDKWTRFQRLSKQWLEDRYGKGNIVNMSVHYDERTPHIHAYVVPVKEKTVKWKNKNGQGEKIVKTLCARDYLGGKDKMREMQDSFHDAVGRIGLERGQKGSPAKHEHIQKFYSRVNEAEQIDKDISQFKPKEVDISLNKPSKMDFVKGLDEWHNKEQRRIKTELDIAKKEVLEQFKDEFRGEIELSMESRKKTRDLKVKTSSLSNDLSRVNEKLVLKGKELEEASKRLEKSRDYVKSWKKATRDAIVKKDPKAIQEIMNALEPVSKAKSNDKDRGMGM